MKILKLFSEISESDNAGGKALNLAILEKNGFNVPAGFVIPGKALEILKKQNPELKNAIASVNSENGFALEEKTEKISTIFHSTSVPDEILSEANEALNLILSNGYKGVAVRSSCSLEDTENASFAGQYESVLNVRNITELGNAILKCWASGYTHRVIDYCKKNNLTHKDISLNIILQGMIPSEMAGVVFTVNPLTGDDKEMVIEAVRGLGEALVQGTVNPDTYNFNWYNNDIKILNSGNQEKMLICSSSDNMTHWENADSKAQILTNKQIEILGQTALDIQCFYGSPQDIEWAYFNNKFYILQSRPLTSINFKTSEEWTTADLKDGGISSAVATPMMYSLYKYAFENSMPVFLKSIHVYPKYEPESWFTWFMGYSYWNMKAVKEGAKKIPGFVERKFDEDLGIEPTYKGSGHITKFNPVTIINGIKILLATKKSINSRVSKCLKNVEKTESVLNELKNLNLHNLSDKELFKMVIRLLKEDYLHSECSYFNTIYDNSNATTLLHESLEKYNKSREKKVSYLKLITGIKNISHMLPVIAMWHISRKIKANAEYYKYFSAKNPNELASLYNTDDPNLYLLSDFKNFIKLFGHHSLRELDIREPNWHEDLTPVFEMLSTMIRQDDNADPSYQNQKQFEIFTEEINSIKSKKLRIKIEQHRSLLWWREQMRDYSTKIYAEIRRFLLEANSRLVNNKTFDADNDIFYLTFQELETLLNTGNTINSKHLILKNKSYYKSFRNFKNPNEIVSIRQKKKIAKTSETISGIACSSGNVISKVVVVKNIYDTHQIEDGDILVTKYTDPAWTPVFAKISGLVTETGGMLSHGAVVSREYGIPAVLAVQNATKILKSGDKIQLNGDTGEIEIISKNSI